MEVGPRNSKKMKHSKLVISQFYSKFQDNHGKVSTPLGGSGRAQEALSACFLWPFLLVEF
jgi:hypothetical protein